MQPSGSLAWVLFTTSIPLLINHFCEKDRAEDAATAFKQMESGFNLPENETFDFIIGTAGCILARRLSEKYTVLLLEAGGEPPPVQAITTLVYYIETLPVINWLMGSSRERNAALSSGGEILTTSGKMLGGSGSHNDVQYERGSPYDYNNWAEFTGDSTWRYENVLQYFDKIEKWEGDRDSHGMIDVVISNLTHREDLWFYAAQELGYEVLWDTSRPQRIGFATATYNRRAGKRVGAYTEYLVPVMGRRQTLTVRKYSLVTRVQISDLRAKGVQYEWHGVPRIAFASKEVILSAGAYNSPVILMRSGIGPQDQLDAAGVKAVLNLPVGLNFQTHAVLRTDIAVEDQSVFYMTEERVSFSDFEEFKAQGTGYLSARRAMQEAFVASSRAEQCEGKPNWPDLQIYLGQGEVNGKDAFSCGVTLARPRSHGRILLNLTATTTLDRMTPILEHNFFSDETDYDVMFDGIRLCQRIAKTSAFQNIGANFLGDDGNEWIPECRDFEPDSRNYWICYIRYNTHGNVHASSTVRMGRCEDSTAVLDSKFRVKGIQGLRVVDASTFPFITNTNINAAVMMLAEKASEEIQNSWQ